MNEDDLERKLRLLEQKMQEWDNGYGGVDISKISDEDLELFEELMRDFVLPHLMGPGGVGDIKDIKVIRLGHERAPKPKDKDSDLTWLDKYL